VRKPVTLRDVAILAKVSTSTASRALTGDPRILPSTKARVTDAVAKLNYLPNRIASSLRSKSTGIIGIAINNLDNYTFRTIFEHVGIQASKNSLLVLLVTTDGDPSREAQFLDTARELQLDGVILAGTGKNAEKINLLVEKGFSVVITNRSVPQASAPTIIPDYELSCSNRTSNRLRS
jgi:LacI family transcriptional regulator